MSPESLRRPIAELRLADPDIAVLGEFAERALSPTAVDENGWTDLHYVALLNRPDLVEALLDTGADVSAKGSDGWTPLHLAVWWNNAPEAATALIAGGANVNAKNSNGDTPLQIARSRSS